MGRGRRKRRATNNKGEVQDQHCLVLSSWQLRHGKKQTMFLYQHKHPVPTHQEVPLDHNRVQILPDHRLTFRDGGDGRKGRPKGRFHSGLIGNRKDLMQYAQGHTY